MRSEYCGDIPVHQKGACNGPLNALCRSPLFAYLHGRVGDDGRRLGVEGLAKLHHVQPQRTERLLIRKGTEMLLNI